MQHFNVTLLFVLWMHLTDHVVESFHEPLGDMIAFKSVFGGGPLDASEIIPFVVSTVWLLLPFSRFVRQVIRH